MATDETALTQDSRPTLSGTAGKFLQFRIPGVLLCLPLDAVERVLPLVEWQPMPGAASFLRGLLNLHGEAVPVIDLAARLGHPARQHYQLDTPILLCRAGGRVAGLIAEEILGVIDATDIEHADTTLDTGDLPFTSAFDSHSGLTLLINVDRILNFRLDREDDAYADAATAQMRAIG